MRNEFRINGILFSSDIDKRTNTEYVHSLHPYDLQKYHWARRSPKNGNWIVYRNGETITCYSKSNSTQEIAEILLCHDEDLPSRIDRT